MRGTIAPDSHLYTGKELDRQNGADTYDYHARTQLPGLGQFLQVDPKCEKTPWLNPYVFCAGNPIRNIDLNGMDIWNINRQGEIVSHIQETRFDRFNIVDDRGELTSKSIGFKYGTIERSERRKTNSDEPYDVYQLRGDYNGEQLFEFLSDNTEVEWSNTKLGEPGDNGINVIATSHSVNSEEGSHDMFKKVYIYGYTIREDAHSHPGGTMYPSGTRDGTGDICIAKKWSSRYKKNEIKFYIYIPNSGGLYILYNKDSQLEDFIDMHFLMPNK